MTRSYVYGLALAGFIAATIMLVVSISLPDWISFSTTSKSGQTYSQHIGLHKSCTNALASPDQLSSAHHQQCVVYPTPSLCQHGERFFCSMWRSIGFLASLSVILHLVNVVSFAVVMVGGKYQRQRGWPLISIGVGLVALVEFAIMAMVAYLYENDEQFVVPGWRLDTSWILVTASATVSVLVTVGLAVSAYVLPAEDGYEFLEDPADP